MSRFMSVSLLLGAALSLPAAQLTVGTVAIAPGQTGSVSVSLASAGSSVAGLQFDLNYDRSVLTVTVAAGSAATAAQKSLGSNDVTVSSILYKRALVVGGVSAGGQTVIADGPVATLNITVAAGAALGNQPLTLTNLAGTTAAATLVPLTGTAGSVTVANTFMVGNVFPSTGDTLGTFGHSGPLTLNDVINILLVTTSAPGFPPPAACSDRFDAMDTFPVDTPTTRGGDKSLGLNDLIVALLYQTSAPGYTTVPFRASRGGVCAPQSLQSNVRTGRTNDRPTVGALEMGRPESAGGGQERVPVYIRASREMARVAVAFSAGDQQSQLRFTAGDVAPTIAQDRQAGFVAVAWLDGVSIRAGGRLLLGYVTGPTGFSANLKVFGSSASGLNDNQEVGLEVPGGTAARQ